MAIIQADFDNEAELQTWVEGNLSQFLPGVFAISGCRVTTVSGKHGVPDGFAFCFAQRQWYVIENDLLAHGVWPHIAEQITRFVVALQNPATRRKIRDHLFERLISGGNSALVIKELGTSSERLLQQLESFIEDVPPELLIFIDDTNQDLLDMAHALAMATRVYRVKKFIVNGKPEYYSPDHNVPIITTEPVENSESQNADNDVIELLGGGELVVAKRRFKAYRLKSDGSLVTVKYSKYHEQNNYYWYGIGAVGWAYCEENSVTHMIFVMGDEGFAKVPIAIVREFLKETGASKNPDGSIRHYHLLISPGPNPEMYWSNDAKRFSLTDWYQQF